MVRYVSQIVPLITILLTLCPTVLVRADNGPEVQISAEAYEAFRASQEAADREDWKGALMSHKEANLYLVKSAEQFVESGDIESAIKLYRMIILENPHSLTHDPYGACRSLTSTIHVERTNVFDALFWYCPEDILTEWVGGVEAFDQLEPKLTNKLDIDFGPYRGETDLVALTSFAIDPAGEVTNLAIDCENQAFSDAIRLSLENAKFKPAKFRGEPITRPRMKRAFVWKPTN